MDIFLQQIINGLVQGSIYALVALGYTMVYGIMGLINFAHGEVVMIGTLISISVASTLLAAGVPGLLAGLCGLLAAVLCCMALGWSLERIAYRPLRGAPRLTPLITAIGMSIVLQNLAMMIWGRNYLTFPSLLPKVNFELAGAHFTAIQVIIVLVSGATMAGLLGLIYRTKLGMAMRATSQNPAVASLMGVNINRVIAAAFVIGSALGAVAGVTTTVGAVERHDGVFLEGPASSRRRESEAREGSGGEEPPEDRRPRGLIPRASKAGRRLCLGPGRQRGRRCSRRPGPGPRRRARPAKGTRSPSRHRRRRARRSTGGCRGGAQGACGWLSAPSPGRGAFGGGEQERAGSRARSQVVSARLVRAIQAQSRALTPHQAIIATRPKGPKASPRRATEAR